MLILKSSFKVVAMNFGAGLVECLEHSNNIPWLSTCFSADPNLSEYILYDLGFRKKKCLELYTYFIWVCILFEVMKKKVFPHFWTVKWSLRIMYNPCPYSPLTFWLFWWKHYLTLKFFLLFLLIAMGQGGRTLTCLQVLWKNEILCYLPC